MNIKEVMLSITFLFFTVFINAQNSNNINIQGYIKGNDINQGTVSIIPISMGLDCMAYKFDTITVSIVNNRFHFSGFMPYPHGFEALFFNSKGKNFSTSSFFLDSGNISITCVYDSINLSKPSITLSKTDKEYRDKFLPKFNPIQNLLDSFLNQRSADRRKYNGKVPDSVTKKTSQLRTKYLLNRNVFLRKYIKGNPKSFIPISMLGQSIERLSDDAVEIEKTFNLLSSKMKNTISGIKIKEAITLKKLGPLSDALKNTTFYTKENSKKSIDTRSNKYVLVDFWFAACKPCIAQFPKLKDVFETYRSKGFEVIGINTDKGKEDWINAVEKHKIHWEQLWDKDNFTSTKLLIYSFPTNFLIDTNGKIISKNIEPSELSEFLANKLK